MKKRTYRRRRAVSGFGVPKKFTGQHLKGAALGIGGETVIDMVAGGFLTDTTGRYLKIAGGLSLLFTNKSQMLQGVGLGVAVNNAYAKFVSDSNETIGSKVLSLVQGGAVAGNGGYSYLIPGSNQKFVENGVPKVVRR